MIFGNDARLAGRITRACRRSTRLPLWVKLSPNVTDIREPARAAEAEGADAVSLVNTFVGMMIDVDKRAAGPGERQRRPLAPRSAPRGSG